jgi:hypothetical protein
MTIASVSPEQSPTKVNTVGVGDPVSLVKSCLYCSKVKNLVALLGVSARIGGKIPL